MNTPVFEKMIFDDEVVLNNFVIFLYKPTNCQRLLWMFVTISIQLYFIRCTPFKISQATTF